MIVAETLWFGWVDPYVILLSIVAIIIAGFVLRKMNRAEDKMMEDYYKAEYGHLPDVWLEMSEGVSIGIKAWVAYSLDARGFYKLYMDHEQYNRPTKTEAWIWAYKQVDDREEAQYMAWYMGDDAEAVRNGG